jgi:hypothetical protein
MPLLNGNLLPGVGTGKGNKMFAIGKASRFKAGDSVHRPPYEKVDPDTIYDLLRVAIFQTESQAMTAAKICESENPVGFVVLNVILEQDNQS